MQLTEYLGESLVMLFCPWIKISSINQTTPSLSARTSVVGNALGRTLFQTVTCENRICQMGVMKVVSGIGSSDRGICQNRHLVWKKPLHLPAGQVLGLLMVKGVSLYTRPLLFNRVKRSRGVIDKPIGNDINKPIGNDQQTDWCDRQTDWQ